jgi:hypothetical protein
MRATLLAACLLVSASATAQQPAQKPTFKKPAVNSGLQTGTFNVRGAMNAVVGGSDDCSVPDAIAGEGSTPFDNSVASTGAEGQTEYLCYQFGSSTVDNDVWFAWTAAATGPHNISTCGGTSVDTKLAVYAGAACPAPGTSIVCLDDSCGLQQSVSVNATAGSTYMIQLGCFPGATGGTGTLDISQPAPASGNDDCSAPDAIAGQGVFSYDSSAATTGAEGQTEYICYDFGSSAVDSDIWFSWTSDFTGNARVSTCNIASYDTKIAAYPGSPSCPTAGSSLACNDDFTGCAGFSSEMNFTVTTGSVYMLQIGAFPGSAGGIGTFDISNPAPPVAHPQDECAGALAIAGTGTFPWDTANPGTATTGADGQNENLCYAFGSSAVNNDIWFAWTANATGLADVTFCNGATTMDTKIAAWPNACPPVAGSILACNDDTCGLISELQFNATSGTTYLIQVGAFGAGVVGGGDFDIAIAGAPGGPGTAYCSGDGSGTTACPCGNGGASGAGCTNGSGLGGALGASGSASVSVDTLVLEASQLLPNQPALFFQGDNAINGGSGISFGDGLRCAGGGVIRLQVRFPDAAGACATSISISAKGGCVAGDVKRYQAWYRDPATSPCGAAFNLSNGYEISWGA